MDGKRFIGIIEIAFSPFLADMGFSLGSVATSGRLYRADFNAEKHVLSVSYEPGEDYLLIVLFGRGAAGLSDIDDRSASPRLSDLNFEYMSQVSRDARIENEVYFHRIVPGDAWERDLLKAARELRLVLPLHLARTGVAKR